MFTSTTDFLTQLRTAGYTAKEIGESFGWGSAPTFVNFDAPEASVQVAPQNTTATVVRLQGQGLSYRGIAKRTGLTMASVGNRLYHHRRTNR